MTYNKQTQSVTLTVEELAEALRTALGELSNTRGEMIPKNSVPAKVLRRKIVDLLSSDGGGDAVVDFLLDESLVNLCHLQA